MKKIFGAALLLAALVSLSACGTQAQTDETEGLQVVTTFFPMYDFTRNIVGDAGTVTMLVPAGTEAHDYEPSARDIASIQNADAFVYNSHEMETWVTSALNSIDTSNLTVIEAAKNIELMEWSSESDHSHDHDTDDHSHDSSEADDHSHDSDDADHSHDTDDHSHDSSDADDHSHDSEDADHSHDSDDHSHDSDDSHGHSHSHDYDPHVWLSPALAIKQVETIRDGLIEAYPQARETFEKNAAAYIEKLKALDEEFRTSLQDATQRTFVVQHAGFAYLAREYNLNQVAIAGISADQEPTAARLAELKHFVTEHNINIIYFQENASDNVARTLADEAGVELAVLNPLEGITNERIAAGDDYISVMQGNLQALLKTIR